jgi:inosine/xanthosine triphosphate pyrophosphatase family protein
MKTFLSATILASKNPEKLKELQSLFMRDAEKYHVLPIDDRLAWNELMQNL